MGAQGCVIVFDLSNKTSYESLIKWIEEIKSHLPNILISIVGNKVDLPGRRVTKEEGESFAKKHDVAYFETSAKEGTGIDIVFNHMTKEIMKKIPKKN